MKIGYKRVVMLLLIGVTPCIWALTPSEAQYEERLKTEGALAQKKARARTQEQQKIASLQQQIAQTKAQIKAAFAAQKAAKTEKDADAQEEKAYTLGKKAEQLQTQVDALMATSEAFKVPSPKTLQK